MKEKNLTQQFINYGLLISIIISALIALIVSNITQDDTIWSWAIPVGAAVGVAISNRRNLKK